MQPEIFYRPDSESSLATWLAYLERLHTKPIELGLQRIMQVAQVLDVLKPAPIVFTVAGTNGKGTTCRALETILLAAGYRVGVYSSPHLLRYTERVRILGCELEDTVHCSAFTTVEQQRLKQQISLTYFEFSTLAALLLFQQAALDVVILEVGMGGRLDATNIIDADLAIITTIDLDHTEWLGNDRQSIGREKAGIIRANQPVIFGESTMPDSIAEVVLSHQAKLYRYGIEWHYQQQEKQWSWSAQDRSFANLPIPAIPLANAATALAALYYADLHHLGLQIDDRALMVGLHQAQLPGRFQRLQQSPLLIVDVAHNPHAAHYLVGQLRRLPTRGGAIRLVVGMLADKDIAGTLAELQPVATDWYCASLSVPRGATSAKLAGYLTAARQFNDVGAAWKQAMQDAAEDDIVLACGSFHTVAQVIQMANQGERNGQ